MRFCVMLDMSRNAVMRVGQIKKFIDIAVKFGYNAFGIYMEDVFEIKEEPYFGYLRGRYTERELKELDEYCAKKGVELIPFVQTLAHLNGIFRWQEYEDIRDINDILLIGEEKTYRLITRILQTVKKCFSSPVVHIGMDEAHGMGLGKYLEKHGLCDRTELFVEHLAKVVKIARGLGLEPVIWSDMFFRLANGITYENMSAKQSLAAARRIKEKLPNVGLCYWDYYSESERHYSENIKTHKTLSDNVWFAGGCWSWVGFAPLNAHSLKTSLPAMTAARKQGVENIVITVWGDNGGETSRFSVLPALFYCKKVYDGITDIKAIKKEFGKITGESFDAMLKLDLPNYAYVNDGSVKNACKNLLFADPFVGYTDTSVDYSCEKTFEKSARALVSVKSANFGVLFEEARKLCRVLAVKCTLGKRLRKAYLSGDKTELSALVAKIKITERRLEEFYRVFRARWVKENKSFGIEVQDIRIGGLLYRLQRCRETLAAYLNGGAEIEELNEVLLEYVEDGESGNRSLVINDWLTNASVNVL